MDTKSLSFPEQQGIKLAQANGLLGGLIWPAASVLCRYILENSDLVNGKEIIELGAGTGAVGIYAAATFDCSMTLTEVRPKTTGEDDIMQKSDRLLDLLRGNVDLNRALFTSDPPQILEVDFSDSDTAKKAVMSSKTGKGYDLILASDVTYTPSLHQPLADTLALLLSARLTSRCILTHTERLLNNRGEDYQLLQFLEALEKAGLEMLKHAVHHISDETKIHKVSVLEIQFPKRSDGQ